MSEPKDLDDYLEKTRMAPGSNAIASADMGDVLGVSPEDNRQHRSKGMLCGTCMFNVKKVTDIVQRGDHLIGRCRRNAPTMNGWPVVFSDDWCGNHKLDETKL